MKIESISIGGYRAVTKMIHIPLGQLTVLTGPNNIGKSTILHALNTLLGERRNPNPSAANRTPPPGKPRGYPDLPARLELNLILDDEDWKRNPLPADLPQGAKQVKLVFGDHSDFPSKISPSSVGAIVEGSYFLDDGMRQLFRWADRNIRFVYIPANRSVEGLKNGLFAEIAAGSARQRLGSNSEVLDGYLREIESAIEETAQNLLDDLRPFIPTLESVKFELSTPQLEDILRIKEVYINDGSNSRMELKGDGFKSMFVLALLHYFARQRHRRTLIFGIEEPEAHLHSDAIYAGREAIRRLSTSYQTLITTHSPIYVRRDDIGATILIGRASEDHNQIIVKQAESLREIRNSLGIRRQENMLSASTVLLVEGVTDRKILMHLLKLSDTDLAQMLDEGVVQIVATKGAKYMKTHVEYLERDLTNTIVFLDGDSAGTQTITELRAQTSLGLNDFKQVPVLPGFAEREIEDCFDPKLWAPRVAKQCGLSHLTAESFETARSRCKKSGRTQKWSVVMETIAQQSMDVWDQMKPLAKDAFAAAIVEGVRSTSTEDLAWVRLLADRIKSHVTNS